MGQSERKPAEMIDIKEAGAFLAKKRAERAKPKPVYVLPDARNDDERLTQAMQREVFEMLEDRPVLTAAMMRKLLRKIGFRLSHNIVLNRHEDHEQEAPVNLLGIIRNHFVTMSQFRDVTEDKGYLSLFKDRTFISDFVNDEIYSNLRDPIREYFQCLPLNGPLDYSPFDLLCDHIKDRNNVARPFLRCFLLGCVDQVMGGEQRHVLLLQGKQDLGKSYFVRWLCSGLPEYFQEGMVMPQEKDHRIRLAGKFLWAADEFSAPKNERETERMKDFLTMKEVNDRLVYGTHTVRLQRRCSIVGTANTEELLNDATGNRRYLIVNLERLGHGYARMPVDDLWQEVYSWWLAGERGVLSHTEKALQAVTNEKAEAICDIEDYLKSIISKEPNKRVMISELDQRIVSHYQARSAPERTYYRRERRKIMKKLGFEQQRFTAGEFYIGSYMKPIA